MKKNHKYGVWDSPALKKCLLIMRLFLVISLISVVQTFAFNAYTQNTRISLSVAEMKLEEIIMRIENDTYYRFAYDKNEVDVDKAYSVNVKNAEMEQLLNHLFSKGEISYTIVGRQIVLSPSNVSAITQQGLSISGRVTDSSGTPLPGVSVIVKGSTNGTITDAQGNYTLANVPGDASLQFSFVGMKTQEVAVAGKTFFTITMTEEAIGMDEVMVVGYSTTNKRSLISAVSTVKPQELAALPVANITRGLAGRSPGLIVQASGGGVNQNSTISIRGGGTPLIVIDGVIRSYDDFLTIASENIESFSILKDASATAVYGSRAANGILQIITKSGKSGKPTFEYSYKQSYSQPTIWGNKLNSYQVAVYQNEALINDGYAPKWDENALKKFQDGSDPLNYPNVNWRKLVLDKFAPQSRHNISLTGGNEIHNYYISLSNTHQGALYKTGNNWMNRTNFVLSGTSFVKRIGLKTTAQIDGYLQTQKHPYTSTSGDYWAVFGHIQNASAMTNGVNMYGLPLSVGDNPVAETASDAGYKRSENNVVNGLLNLEWSIPWVNGLKLRAKGDYRMAFATDKQWRKDPAQYLWDGKDPSYAGKPSLDQAMSTAYSWTTQTFAEYTHTFDKHFVSILAGYEQTYGFGRSMSAHRDNYDFAIDQFNPGPNSSMKNGGSESESGRAGFIGQARYNFNNRYFAEASIRYDGSDNFPQGNRWGTFYSGSVGWSLADESFMSRLKERHIFDVLKLRVSYGQVGLDNWGDPFSIGRFAYLPSYNMNGTSYVINGVYVPGFSEGALPSPDITWFTTNQTDLGFDFSSLNNRIYGMFNYFYYQTKGFLYAPDPLIVGYTDPLGTSLPRISTDGEQRRAGYEFQLGWRDQIGEFKYDIAANFTYFDQLWAKNPAESLDAKKNPYTRTTGQTGYAGIMYDCLGFYTNAEDVMNSPKRLTSSNLTGGDLKYYDYNGDGMLDGADQYRQGKSSFPRGNYGVDINLSYKGWSMGVLFQGATRYDLELGGAMRMQSAQNGFSPIYDFQRDFWTPDNTNARYPRLVSSNGTNGSNNAVTSDFWFINGAYLRLKDLRISYDMKHSLLKKQSWLTKLDIGLTGMNLATFSNLNKYGLDPENGSTEGYAYPMERTIGININLGL